MSEHQRPKSRMTIWLKTCWVFFLILMPFYLFFNLIGITLEMPVVLILAMIFGTWATFFQWAFVTAIMNLWYRNDARYHKWKDAGGRPYWDTVQWPVGPWPKKTSAIETETGLAEPKYTDFVPPPDWRFQCPTCGARVKKQMDVCWRCSYGADGDSTAYYERWGAKPDGK